MNRWIRKKNRVLEGISRPVLLTSVSSEEDKKRAKRQDDLTKLFECFRRKGVSEERIDVFERIASFANLSTFEIRKSLVIELQKLMNIVENIEGD